MTTRIMLLALLAAAPLAGARAVPGPLAPQLRLEAALREAVQASCPGTKLAFDADLSRAARAYVDAVKAGKAETTGQALAFYASLESVDPSPVAGIATTDAPAQADRAVGDLFPKSCRFDRAGVAAALLAPERALVALLAGTRAVELDPLPGRVEELASVRLSGRLPAGLREPRVWHLKPDGAVEDQALPLDAGRRFSLPVRLVETGEHALEILADGAGGPQVVALRRIFAGVEPPASPPPSPPAPTGEGLDAVEQAIAWLRAGRGLPALQRDAQLDKVAEGHSRAMARARTFAHVLPEDGALPDRLRKAGYAHRSAGENIGLADDALTAHEAIAQSPAHLANLLDPRHRRVGLGAARGLSPDGNSSVYVTEVLAAPVVGSKDPAGEVAALVAAERQKRKVAALFRAPELDEVALGEVKALAIADGVPEVRKDAAELVLDSVPGLRSAAADLVVAGSPEDARASKNLTDARWTRFGVGAIYANSKQYGPGRLWVLIVYAR